MKASQARNHQVTTEYVRDCAKALAVGNARVDALMAAIAAAKRGGATREALFRAVAEGGLRATSGQLKVQPSDRSVQAPGVSGLGRKAVRGASLR